MGETPALASTAPVFTVDGTRQGDLARDLLRLDVRDTVAGLKCLTVHLIGTNRRQSSSSDVVEYLDGRLLDFGKRIKVSLGPRTNEKIVFDGVISALEVDFTEGDVPTVVLCAEDVLMRLRLTQRSATYLKVSEADLLQRIATEHGLGSRADADGPQHDVVQQFNQSDLAFLRERAARIQAELWADDSGLRLTTRDRRPGTSVTLTRGAELLSLRARADLAEQCTGVHVSGFDAATRRSIDVEAPGSTVEAETSGGRTGPQTLQRALGVLPGFRVRDVPVVAAEARAYARAEMLARSRRFVRIHGLTAGTPELVVGSRVTLVRCGRPFDGSGYYTTLVHHSYDQRSGLRTRFDAERPTVNG